MWTEVQLEMLTKDIIGDERRVVRANMNDSEAVDERDGGIDKRMAEEQALLAQLESLSVHDSTLSPMVNTGRTLGRKEAGSPVAL